MSCVHVLYPRAILFELRLRCISIPLNRCLAPVSLSAALTSTSVPLFAIPSSPHFRPDSRFRLRRQSRPHGRAYLQPIRTGPSFSYPSSVANFPQVLLHIGFELVPGEDGVVIPAGNLAIKHSDAFVYNPVSSFSRPILSCIRGPSSPSNNRSNSRTASL